MRRIAIEGKRDFLILRVHPDVAMYVLEQEQDFTKKIEKGAPFGVELRDDPLLNPDEFKMRVSGIMSTEQSMNADGHADNGATEPRHQEFESMIVKL